MQAFVIGAGELTLETVVELWPSLDMRSQAFILSTYDTITPAFVDEVEPDEQMMSLLCVTRRDLVKETKQRLAMLLTEYDNGEEINVGQIAAAR